MTPCNIPEDIHLHTPHHILSQTCETLFVEIDMAVGLSYAASKMIVLMELNDDVIYYSFSKCGICRYKMGKC